jgi:hypothetical protein
MKKAMIVEMPTGNLQKGAFPSSFRSPQVPQLNCCVKKSQS